MRFTSKISFLSALSLLVSAQLFAQPAPTPTPGPEGTCPSIAGRMLNHDNFPQMNQPLWVRMDQDCSHLRLIDVNNSVLLERAKPLNKRTFTYDFYFDGTTQTALPQEYLKMVNDRLNAAGVEFSNVTHTEKLASSYPGYGFGEVQAEITAKGTVAARPLGIAIDATLEGFTSLYGYRPDKSTSPELVAEGMYLHLARLTINDVRGLPDVAVSYVKPVLEYLLNLYIKHFNVSLDGLSTIQNRFKVYPTPAPSAH